MKKFLIKNFCLFLFLTLPLFGQSDPSQDSVKYRFAPVLVTATEAKERETPVTFTNIAKGLIQQKYSLQDVPVLLAQEPSMLSYSDGGNGVGYNFVFLRGFDQRRLSIMVNGIPQNDPEDHNVYWIDFPDILASASNIQVQRGAGSAFYGPPAIGGSINIVTNPFTPKPFVKFESMLGFQEFGDSSQSFAQTMRKISASFNSGLVENKYMFYGRLGKIDSKGYRQQSAISMGTYFLGALLLGENSTTRIHLFGGPLQDQLVYLGLPKWTNDNLKLRRMNLSDWGENSSGTGFSYAVQRRPQEKEQFNQPHYEILNEWNLSSDQKLSNTLFYYDSHGWFDYDASWGDASTIRVDSLHGFVPTPVVSNSLVRAGVDLVQWGWLPRYDWHHENGDLTIGGEYRYHRGTHWGKILYAEGLPANFDLDYIFYQYDGIKHMASLYVTEIYRPQADLSVMANVQFAYNQYQIQHEKFLHTSFAVPYYFLNPRVGVNYNLTDEWNSYFSLAYTSREPRLRNLYAAEDAYFDPNATPQFELSDTTNGKRIYDFSKPLVTPEELLDFELGIGYNSSKISGTANVYWMEFTHELVKSGQVDIFGNPVYGNADRTRHIGFEVDGSLSLPMNFSLHGNVSLSKNSIVKLSTVIVDSTDINGINYTHKQNLNGNPIAGFPDVMGNLEVTYKTESLYASLTMKYVGSFYTDNFKDEKNKNDAYTVLNFETVYTLPKIFNTEFQLRGEVRNLLNKLYLQTGEGNAFFPAAERNYLLGVTVQL
ncbi:MAG: TonB-dependent receptor [Bacteroidetes bacterium]|nr:TonB-dependent receptor [Bacteroidota bacterium]